MSATDRRTDAWTPPAHGPADREIIVTDTLRAGQPRAYADTERVVRISVYRYDWRGDCSDGPLEHAYLLHKALRAEYNAPYLVSPEMHEALRPHFGSWLHAEDFEIHDSSTAEGHFRSYLDYARVLPTEVALNAVEIRYVSPSTD